MKFSIIVPVYNAARYLRECLDSVLAAARTLSEECKVNSEKCGVNSDKCGVEIICVDDGSTDESGAILDEYVEKVEKLGGGGQRTLKVLHQTNAGVAAARNAALDVAQGEWVVFLDADDFWSPDLLQKMMPILEQENPDIVRFSYTKFKDGEVPRKVDQPLGQKVIVGDEVVDWALRTLTKGGYCWACLIRRSMIGASRFPVGVKYAEDSLFLLRIAHQATRVVQTDYAGYLYRNTPDSAMKRAFGSEERLRFFSEFQEICSLYRTPHASLSWMAWFNLVSWIRKPAEIAYAKELREIFSSLWRKGWARLSDLALYARFPSWLYARLGWRWPTTFVYAAISGAVRVRDRIGGSKL